MTDLAHDMAYVGRIPVRNLWLLMLYASDLFRLQQNLGQVSFEEDLDELPDLVARILADVVERRLRRQLSRGYHTRQANLTRVRGRIDILKTERHSLLQRGLVACEFEEMTIDTPRNRFVRHALQEIGILVKKSEVAHRCRSLANELKLMGVSGIVPSRKLIDGERFGRHDASDRLMVAAAKLAVDLAMPTESTGGHQMVLPDREGTWVRKLFERAVGGFYDVVLRPEEWSVKPGRKLNWQVENPSPGILKVLPNMQVDILLDHHTSGQRLVIDTKFNHIFCTGRFGHDRLRSGYVYQMYGYLNSQAGQGKAKWDNASGLLLHPAIGAAVDEWVTIQNHTIRFATVDLTASAFEVREQLLRVIEIPPEF